MYVFCMHAIVGWIKSTAMRVRAKKINDAVWLQDAFILLRKYNTYSNALKIPINFFFTTLQMTLLQQYHWQRNNNIYK